MNVSWLGSTQEVNSILVQQKVGDEWVTRWTGEMADANGSSLTEVSQKAAGQNVTGVRYNAFGEVTAKGSGTATLNDWQEYFDYDAAGRLWRTNSGDGVDKIYLYDAQGNRTSELRSTGAGRNDLDVRSMTSAASAEAKAMRRTDFTYDLAGRLTRTIHPERLEEQGGVAVQRMVLAASIVTAVNAGPRAEDEGGGYGWNGTNEVTLSWNNLDALGSGDVKVSITYTSTLGVSRTRESGDLLAKDGAQGTRITWSPGSSSDEGIQQVTRIVLWKKDVNGTWRKIADQAPGNGANVIDLAAPGDLRTTEFLKFRKTGTTTWITANLLDFGDSRRYLGTADLVTGTYEYLMGVTPPGGAEWVVATGTLQLKADGTMVQTTTDNQDVSWVRPVVSQILDRWGNVLQITDPRSADWVTTYKYNANNQVVMQTLPEEVASTRIYYDALGRQVAVRDALDRVNGQVYDGGGNLYREIHADEGAPTYRYDVFGQKVSVTDALGHTVNYRYDRGGNLLEMRKGTEGVYTVQPNMTVTALGEQEIVERWTYDERGQKLTHANGENEITSYRYDLVGNVVARTQPLQQTTYTAYDASGRKTTELDGNLNAARWTYDYFGRLQEHQDIGGARYTYSYDHARQLTMQTNTRGQKLTYRHDAAGQVLAITDWDGPSNKVSSYAYDLSGNRLREKTVEGGVTYQDNHLGYDARGRLRDVADARVHMTLWYDAVGNRSRVKTSVNYQGVAGEQPYASDRYFLYDSMNRQVVVGALDAAGELMDGETHKVAYDLNGNRVSDTYIGTRVGVSGTSVAAIESYTADGVAQYNSAATYVKQENRQIVERYTYDDLNRLETVERSGMQVDVRRYDAADRVVSSGVANLPLPYRELLQDAIEGGQLGAINKYVNRFNDNGQLQRQVIHDAANAPQTDIIWEAGQVFAPGEAFRPAGYDGAGNVAGYAVINRSTGATTTYSTTFKRFDSYQADATTGTSTSGSHGNNVQVYDTNGFLVQVLDGTDPEHNRTFVNDAQGRALFVEQGQTARRQLIVNGEVMGAYGVGLHELAPWDGGGNPNYVNLADFNFSYSKVTGGYPAPSPGAYVVRPGDTLQSVAQGAYGDASLWYVIAQANGLDSPDAMRVGQTLNIPNRVGTTGNSEHVFKPYDPSRITGDLTPNMPMPEAGCGAVGQILIIVVAVVVTIFTAGAAAAALGAAASATSGVAAASAVSLSSTFASGVAALSGSYGLAGAAAAVVGGAVGSTVSQGFAVAAGIQQDFNWKAVALSAISAGIGAGVGSIANATGVLAGGRAHAVIGRAMIGNVASQGVSVALGLQDRFNWRGVAASGVGAAVGHVVGDALGMHAKDFATATPFSEQVAKRFVAGFAAGSAAAVVRGGKVVVQQVAADAFGNALGNSLADAASGPRNTPQQDFRRSEISEQNAQARMSDLLYGFAAGGGIGFRASGSVGLTYGGALANEQLPPMPADEDVAWREHVARTKGNTSPSISEADYWSSRAPTVVDRYVDTFGGEARLTNWRSSTPVPTTPGDFRRKEISDGNEIARTLEQQTEWNRLRQGAWNLRTASVSPGYKAATAFVGMFSDGLGVVAGATMTATGLGLMGVPEPTTLTKWAGVPLTLYGATYTTKSAVGLGLNATNFVSAIRGLTDESSYLPGSALEWGVRAAGGSPDHERLAVAADMAWGFANGRLLDLRLPTTVMTNPRVAALFQPATLTTVNREATLTSPQTWQAWTKLDANAGLVDWSVKTWENFIQPEFLSPQK